jgi:pyridoxine 4-dehydrogenase
MHLAGPWAVNAPPDRASALGVIRAAVTAGIDHIDTAQYYGPDVVNDLIREALHPYPGELAIVSKVGVFGGARAAIPHDDARQLREGIEDNLRSLRVDQLAPNVLLIPGTGSTGHLRENLAAAHVALDDEALRDMAGVGS